VLSTKPSGKPIVLLKLALANFLILLHRYTVKMADPPTSDNNKYTPSGDKQNKPKDKAPFAPKADYTLLSQGAEARIWKIPAAFDGTTPTMVAKERFSKSYRHPILDEKLTKTRCRAEGRILEKCRTQKDSTKCIDVPKVLRTEPPVLYIEFIQGMTVREYLEEHILIRITSENEAPDQGNGNGNGSFADNPKLHSMAKEMGIMIGKLHNLGIVHGDLTTSNMMLREERKRAKANNADGNPNRSQCKLTMTLIDFGLAKSTASAEERAVDLYVLERALASTHPKLPSIFFQTILESYKPCLENKAADAALQRLEQVRLRGRKRDCFG
jgi:TP53 regulating kinase-like protein